MKKILPVISLLLVACGTLEAAETGTMTDERDNLEYRTIVIGEKTWLAENLAYKTADSFVPNGNQENTSKYGLLYTWQTAKSVCPQGWRLPEKKDFSALLKAVCGRSRGGDGCADKLNNIGFNIMLAGERESDGDFDDFGNSARFWSATQDREGDVYTLEIENNQAEIDDDSRNDAYSVRCVKD